MSQMFPSHLLWKHILGLPCLQTQAKRRGGGEISFGKTSLAELGNLKKNEVIER